MKRYLFDVDDDRWLAFKLVATKQGLKIKDAIIEALDFYIEKYAQANQDFKIEIIRAEKQRNLRAIIDEQELITIIQSLIKRKPPRKYDPYRTQLKNELVEKLRKGIVITDRVAEELENLIKQCQEDFSPELIQSISQLLTK